MFVAYATAEQAPLLFAGSRDVRHDGTNGETGIFMAGVHEGVIAVKAVGLRQLCERAKRLKQGKKLTSILS